MKKITYFIVVVFLLVSHSVQGQKVLRGSATDSDYNRAYQYAYSNLLISMGANVSVAEKYNVSSSNGVVDKNYESNTVVKNSVTSLPIEVTFDYNPTTEQFTVVCTSHIGLWVEGMLSEFEKRMDLCNRYAEKTKKYYVITFGIESHFLNPLVYKYASREKWNAVAQKYVELEKVWDPKREDPSWYLDRFLKKQQLSL